MHKRHNHALQRTAASALAAISSSRGRRRLAWFVMPEYPESAKNNHADHLDVFRDHHPNVFRGSFRHISTLNFRERRRRSLLTVGFVLKYFVGTARKLSATSYWSPSYKQIYRFNSV